MTADRLTDARIAEILSTSLIRGTADEANECELTAMCREIQQHRAVMDRLAAWAMELRTESGRRGVGPFIAQELENRIAGRTS
jgi:hypothetical protein